jgi:hypothetical protein
MAPTCTECGKRIEDEDPHYREGVSWFHLACYENRKKKQDR